MNTRRSRILGWISAAAWASSAMGHGPGDDPTAARAPETRRCGPIRRSIRHARHTIADGFVGRPENFAVPPLGFDLNENFRVGRSAADIHVFTLYRTDFYADSTSVTPNGLIRLGRLAKDLHAWPGPVLIEPVPDRPGLAEARRDAVAPLLAELSGPVDLGRLMVGASPFPGINGTDAAHLHNAMTGRIPAAVLGYSLTPANTTTFGGGSR